MNTANKLSAKKAQYPSMNVQKFGLIGTSCAGKTTLAYEVLAALKLMGVHADGVLQQDRRFSFQRELLESDPMAQWSFIANQVKAEADMMLRPGTEVLICDRTPLDFYAYYEWQYGCNDALFNFVLDWCGRTFTHIYFMQALPYVNDGARLGEEERDEADEVLKKVISRVEDAGLIVTHVTNTPIDGYLHRSNVLKDIQRSLKRVLSDAQLSLLPSIMACPKLLVGGSYAFNRATKWSDLDIYIETDEPVETGHASLEHHVTRVRDVFGINVEVRGVVPVVYEYLKTEGFREFKLFENK